MGNTASMQEIEERIEEREDRNDIISVIERVASRPKHQYNPSELEKDLRDITNDIESNYLGQEGDENLKKKLSERNGESFLHLAIREFALKESYDLEAEEDKISNHHYRIVAKLILNLRKLVLADRKCTESLDYAGQTPLHMAITKGNIKLTSMLLMAINEDLQPSDEAQLLRKSEREASDAADLDNRPAISKEAVNADAGMHLREMLESRAVGSMFDKTVMMAQIPLSVAALIMHKPIFDLLLKYGAGLDGENARGENVCHSLIKYAYLYPEKVEGVIDLLEYITKEEPISEENPNIIIKRNKLRKKVWRMENLERMNPLQLATKLGQDKIFKFIMGLEAYCPGNKSDGIFDVLQYDITEIDAVAAMSSERRKISTERTVNITSQKSQNLARERKKSVLELIMEIDPLKAISFIEFAPVRLIVEDKWKAYGKLFNGVLVFHLLFVILMTWYVTDRAVIVQAANYTVHSRVEFRYTIQKGQPRAIVPQIFALVFAVPYIVQEIVRYNLSRMPWSFRHFKSPYDNGVFRILFVLFALCLIVDFPFTWVETYENYLLVVAVILGWFLLLFFLRTCRSFSFFTVLIQKVVIGDLFRFSVVLGLVLIAFNTAMFVVLQGSSSTDGEFDTFFTTLKSMFEIMLGIGEIGILCSTRQPGFAISIYVSFVLLTTLLLINALIAMMSNTCTEIVRRDDGINRRDVHWRLQQLSAILFLESILPEKYVNRPGKKCKAIDYSNESKHRSYCTRYMLDMRSRISLDSAEEQTEDHRSVFAMLSEFLDNYHGKTSKDTLSGTISTLYATQTSAKNTPLGSTTVDTHKRTSKRTPRSTKSPDSTRKSKHKYLDLTNGSSVLRGPLLAWFKDYLKDRKQRVALNGIFSEWRFVQAGVPQGSILGPLLFLIYINDIVNEIGANIRLFADDTCLYLIVEDPVSAAAILNKDLITVKSWATKWLVNFNPNKTQSMIISKKVNKPIHPPLVMDGVTLPLTNEHKHLGLIIGNDGTWHSHIGNIVNKGWQRLSVLRNLKFIMDRKSLEKIYFSFVRPALEYGDFIWDNCTVEEKNKIEAIQVEAMRIVTGATKLVSIEKLYEERGG